MTKKNSRAWIFRSTEKSYKSYCYIYRENPGERESCDPGFFVFTAIRMTGDKVFLDPDTWDRVGGLIYSRYCKFGLNPHCTLKKILVPVDFSKGTRQTLDFAIQTAEVLGSKILILNVIDFMEKTVGLRSVNQIIQQDAINRLEKFVAPYKKKSSVQILTKIAKGEPYTVISRQAEISGVDLIIMGAQGDDNEESYFLGKVAGSIIKFKNIPVIVIPKSYQARKVQNIFFMFRKLNKSLFDILPPLFELSDAYQVPVKAVHLTGTGTGTIAYSPELIFENRPFTYEDLKADSFTEGVTMIQARESLDMLCVIKRKRGFLEYIFESSPTPKSVIDSPVPVLFLNDDE